MGDSSSENFDDKLEKAIAQTNQEQPFELLYTCLLYTSLMSRIPESLTEFICVVVTYPLYLLVHRFIGYEYLQVEEKERLRIHFTPIVIGVSFAFLSYGLLRCV